MVVAWLVFGSLLLLFELHHLAFYALFGTIGSVAAAVVALFFPSAVAAQVGVAVGVALAGVVAIRPFVSKAFESHHAGHVARGVHGGLVGEEAITLDVVGDSHLVATTYQAARHVGAHPTETHHSQPHASAPSSILNRFSYSP